jgi:hypothetical protein
MCKSIEMHCPGFRWWKKKKQTNENPNVKNPNDETPPHERNN